MRKGIEIGILVLAILLMPSFVFAATTTFGFNHRVGASNDPYVIIHGPDNETLPTGEDGTTVTFDSDGSAFIDIAVLGMRYEEEFSIKDVVITFSSFESKGGNTIPFRMKLIDPHSNSRTELVDEVTTAKSVTVYPNGYRFEQYMTTESFYTDDLVLFSMKANTREVAVDEGNSTTYSMTVIIDVEAK